MPTNITTVRGNSCGTLYSMCLRKFVEMLTKEAENNEQNSLRALDGLASTIVEHIMIISYETSASWKILNRRFLTSGVSSAIIEWNTSNLQLVNRHIPKITQILITNASSVKAFDFSLQDGLGLLSNGSCLSMDFEGDLFWRGKISDVIGNALGDEWKTTSCYKDDDAQDKYLTPYDDVSTGWLSATQTLLRRTKLKHSRTPRYLRSSKNVSSMLELHLGAVSVTVEDIKSILKSMPTLRILRHYKLTESLYAIHGADWKVGNSLPTYSLRNLDADFSYVGRCTLSVGPTLRMDALRLAVTICPKVDSVNVRFDCSTHHDILQPITDLSELKHFSLVCVSNGERSLLNFDDVRPILKYHGNKKLKSLELKVIELVDVHDLVNNCSKLRSLTLSGCTFSTGNRCYSGCERNLSELSFLLYVESEDESVNNYVPQCFWLSTITGDEEGISGSNKLKCLCLKSPRIQKSVADRIFRRVQFRALEIFTICDDYEFTLDDFVSLTNNSDKALRYVRISECRHLKFEYLQRWRQRTGRYDITVEID